MIKSGQYLLVNFLEVRKDPRISEKLFIYNSLVLFFDDYEVFTDILFDKDKMIWETDTWKKGKCYFSRSSMKFHEKYSTVVDEYPVSDKILSVLQPNLRFRIGRLKGIEWDSDFFSNKKEFGNFIYNETNLDWQKIQLNCNEIYLTPYSKKGSPQTSCHIKAENGKYFTCAELVWQAGQLQKGVIFDDFPGIGIYRSGNFKGIPNFYIGGYLDRARVLESYEKDGVDISLA